MLPCEGNYHNWTNPSVAGQWLTVAVHAPSPPEVAWRGVAWRSRNNIPGKVTPDLHSLPAPQPCQEARRSVTTKQRHLRSGRSAGPHWFRLPSGRPGELLTLGKDQTRMSLEIGNGGHPWDIQQASPLDVRRLSQALKSPASHPKDILLHLSTSLLSTRHDVWPSSQNQEGEKGGGRVMG